MQQQPGMTAPGGAMGQMPMPGMPGMMPMMPGMPPMQGMPNMQGMPGMPGMPGMMQMPPGMMPPPGMPPPGTPGFPGFPQQDFSQGFQFPPGAEQGFPNFMMSQPPPSMAPPGRGPEGRDDGGSGAADSSRDRDSSRRPRDAGALGSDRRGAPAPARDKAAETKQKMEEAEKLKCHLHKKAKNGCKFCKKYQDKLEEIKGDAGEEEARGADSDNARRRKKLDRAISEERDASRGGPLELANPKTMGFSGLLQTHVIECTHFKSLLKLETFDQVIEETFQFANSVEPYMANSGTLPSALFCCLYRFLTLGLDKYQLKKLMEHQESPYIRCCGFLYVRFGLPHDQLLTYLQEYLLDDEELKPSPDSEWRTSVGEYVEGLMSQDKYYNTVLPRLPMVTKRKVEEALAPVGQNRKRNKANKEIIHLFRDRGTRLQCNIGGEWMDAVLVELDEETPYRIKLRVRLDDGSEEYVHLGKVILSESRGRDRARSQSRGRTDWSRDKGKSDKELLDEMRSKEREKAVCSSGKEYAKKPVGYKQACALPREQGTASYKLMEEETFVPINRTKRARSPSPDMNQQMGRRPSAEHQARMQQLFEKYGNQRASADGYGRSSDEVDRPDVMRLG
eukprot:TRINITY_DN13838_c0_g1_i1.p1 TRINITY_DN13838_c0_g1~~TRINITY_DN13838_c0_g1_i1.p1  ORF type:complete len:620 (-),score=142.12 TRINITY_DN13838_c0_g1_i1:140-1999(-)